MGEAGLLAPAVVEERRPVRRARRLPRPRDARVLVTGSPTSPSPSRASARAGVAVRHGGAEAAAARHRGGNGDPRLRPHRAGGGLGRGGDDDHGDGGRRRVPPRRREDLHLERRHRRLVRGVRPHRRGARRTGPLGLHCRGGHAGCCHRRADRDDRRRTLWLASSSTAAGCRPRTGSAAAAMGSRSPWRRSTCFASTVGAAALGFARRALDETLAPSTTRKTLGGKLADLQMTQGALAEMATEIDASALLVYRARVDEGRRRGAGDARGGDGQDGRRRRRRSG